MIKKKTQSEALNKAILIMSKEEFSRKILDRIEEGKKLLARRFHFKSHLKKAIMVIPFVEQCCLLNHLRYNRVS